MNLLKQKKNYQAIFIVGCGHSGTSLLLSILGEHPNIYAIPGESRIAVKNDKNYFENQVKSFESLTIESNKYRWAEKTPKHIHNIANILGWLPSSAIIVIIRDGRDVAQSIKQRTGSLKKGIQRWVLDNKAGLEFWEHPNVYVIRYESIIDDFKASITKLLAFLGEDYHDSMRDFHKTPKKWYSSQIVKPADAFGENHAAYRNWQINQPLFDGRGNWKQLSQEELSLIEEEAGPLLRQLGY